MSGYEFHFYVKDEKGSRSNQHNGTLPNTTRHDYNNNISKIGYTTLSIMTFIIKTHGIMTINIMALCRIPLSMTALNATIISAQ
jgi:hypothetical protein